tara:strand:+ start:290 stop:688 length:399 start_codon:yes stop_codon:yes gene_type:complete
MVLCIFLGCNDQEITNTSEEDFAEKTQPQGLPPGIPSYPYIFEGTFYLNGEKGKDNSRIKSMLGDLDSPLVISSNSEFKNLIIGPRNNSDIENNIEFYLLLEDGEIIKSKEEIPFEIVNKITNLKIELNFEN